MMNASKENAEEALTKLCELSDSIGSDLRVSQSSRIIFLEEFLEAAKKKLPYEKSFPKKAASRP